MTAFSGAPRKFRFASFELDEDAGELRREGIKIRLQDQPFQILTILLDNPGKIVSRDDLREKIWPSNTFVDFDHGINNAIKRLREALGDTAETPVHRNDSASRISLRRSDSNSSSFIPAKRFH